ncbi:alpha/beta hydrolase fold domain-containing protein [Subtercola lobariae]|uniref:Esterase n=1 Tax=Subtercola lobariae TaxID=1588641 RepID=A0A917BE36_9MICO|nr:alpha/beta hydrolase fold domain-containing protein [Subtercola lobariae]GGF37812.1 esterase [Subtercola lobariae]
MTAQRPHPPFDPELAALYGASLTDTPFAMTADMLPFARTPDLSDEEIDEALRARGLERRDFTISGYRGDEIVVSTISRPGHTGSAACFYTIHGGGMIVGSRLDNLASFDEWMFVHDAVMVTVEYRLAPEHPDPFPVEDCYAGLEWTAANADLLGIDPARIVIVGTSAGGGLAAGTALLARDRQGPALHAQILMCPMLDDRDRTVSAEQIDGVGVWDRQANNFGWSSLLGDRRGGDDVSVYAAPARATDLSGLPQTYIDCGSAEVFRDEAVAYASGLWAAGINAELHVWAGGFHAFPVLVPNAAVSRAATAALASFTARILTV